VKKGFSRGGWYSLLSEERSGTCREDGLVKRKGERYIGGFGGLGGEKMRDVVKKTFAPFKEEKTWEDFSKWFNCEVCFSKSGKKSTDPWWGFAGLGKWAATMVSRGKGSEHGRKAKVGSKNVAFQGKVSAGRNWDAESVGVRVEGSMP